MCFVTLDFMLLRAEDGLVSQHVSKTPVLERVYIL